MADTAFLMYEAPNGELRGTLIGRMAYQVQDQIFERFGADYDQIVEFIEAGRMGGGYIYATDDAPRYIPEEDDRPATLEQGLDADHALKLLPNGTVKHGELKSTITFVAA